MILITSCLIWIYNDNNRKKLLLSKLPVKESNSNISLLSMESISSRDCNENNNIDDCYNNIDDINIYDGEEKMDTDYHGKKHKQISNSNEINSILKSISSDENEPILTKKDSIVNRHNQFNDIITKLNEVNQQNDSIIKNDIINNSNNSTDTTDTNTVLNSNANSNISMPITSLCQDELVYKIMNPLLKGCELDHPNVLLLTNKYKNLNTSDVIRFLIARKGKLELTIEMIDKYLEWHDNIFPIQINQVKNVIESNCFLIHKHAIDQTPVLYMRGAYYDNRKATPLQYVLLASHLIEYTLHHNPNQINVTVVVNTSNITNAPNLPPDLAFIRLFVKVIVIIINSYYRNSNK